MKSNVPLAVLLGLGLLLGAKSTPPAAAAFPGHNGLIAFTRFVRSGSRVYTVAPQGGRAHLLAAGPRDADSPTWAPSGRMIAFVTDDGHGIQRLVVADARGESRRVLVREPLGRDFLSGVGWYPDGRRIVFSVSNSGGNRSEISTLDLASGRRRSNGSGWQPSVSPDGRNIAFASGPSGDADIWMMNADGTDRHRLTTGPKNDTEPDWSPDGKQIVFVRNWDIYVINADGGGLRRLTHNSVYDLTPVWSPDGRKIAFSSRRVHHNFDIYVMNPDGSDLTRLTRDLDDDQGPSWQPLPFPARR